MSGSRSRGVRRLHRGHVDAIGIDKRQLSIAPKARMCHYIMRTRSVPQLTKAFVVNVIVIPSNSFF
jgi:hypothetical protein